MIPEAFIEQLKYASDVESIVSSYVTLKRAGRNLSGLCPFHSEKTPSFTVYPDSQSYYCFGCGSGGDVITFVRNIENLEYMEALRFLAQKAGLALPENAADDAAARLKSKIYEMNRESARFFHTQLTAPSGAPAMAYLRDRGLSMKTIRSFGVGYAPPGWDNLRKHLRAKGFSEADMIAATLTVKGRNDSCYDMFRDRVIFPIIDLRGNVIGFGGRAMETTKGPKYLNSSDTPVFKKSRNLFALGFAKNAGKDFLILGEGYMDVIAMHQAGFTNAVATLGTSLTEEQARLISSYARRVIIAYDSDGAGQAATKRAINLFAETDVAVSVLEMQGAKDPDEYIKKFGAQRFSLLLEKGKGAVHFEIDKLKAQHDINTAEGKVAFLSDFCKLMAGITGDLQREVYIGEIAREIDVGRDRVLDTVTQLRRKNAKAGERKASRDLKVYPRDQGGKNSGQPRSGAGPRNLAQVVAEDKLITMLAKNPDYFGVFSGKLSEEDFSDTDNREIYAAITARLRENKPVEMIYMSALLSQKAMSKFSMLEATGRDLQFIPSQAEEYMEAILAAAHKMSRDELVAMSPEQLAQHLKTIKK